MSDRWINIVSLVSGIAFGILGTFISLQPSEAEIELLTLQKETNRIAMGKAVHGYLDDVERISKIKEPDIRLSTLEKFEIKIEYLKATSNNIIEKLFKQIENQKQFARNQITEIKTAEAQAQAEAEKQRVIREQKAAEIERKKRLEAEKRAAQLNLERQLGRERICFNRSCTDWIMP